MSYSRKKYNKPFVGVGGWKCVCCGPSPKNRKYFKRLIKHRENRAEFKIEMLNLEPEFVNAISENIWDLYEE